MKEEILDFIKRRWREAGDLFQNENCYWFARILEERFPSVFIAYDAINGHFVGMDKQTGELYDSKGVYKDSGAIYLLHWIKTEEPNWYERLMKNCRD